MYCVKDLTIVIVETLPTLDQFYYTGIECATLRCVS